jgi:hypothetical protein
MTGSQLFAGKEKRPLTGFHYLQATWRGCSGTSSAAVAGRGEWGERRRAADARAARAGDAYRERLGASIAGFAEAVNWPFAEETAQG